MRRAFARQHGLPRDKVWRSWEAGPSKLFLNDLEQRFNWDMVGHLRELGMRHPVATTNTWGGKTAGPVAKEMLETWWPIAVKANQDENSKAPR